jgi:hypothetical protein
MKHLLLPRGDMLRIILRLKAVGERQHVRVVTRSPNWDNCAELP